MDRIGLIAGNRRFPIIVSQGAKKSGVSIFCVAIKGETSAEIKKYVDRIYWVSIGEFESGFRFFKEQGLKQVIMAGQISPWRLFSREVRQNRQIQELFSGIRDRKANTIFSALANKLEAEGLELIDSTTFIKELVPQKQTLTKRQPSPNEWSDINFGLGVAKAIAGLDIGLAVAVKDKAVVAVEALEGTDNLIRRAGKLVNSGIVIVKVARPGQDMRVDIPVVGLNTIRNLIRAKVTSLAIEADKTLFLDMQPSIALADKRRLAIVAV